MTSIKKISSYQLAVLLIASRLFSEAVNFPLKNTEYSMQRFGVIFIAYIILFIQYIPLIILSKKYSGEGPVGLLSDRSKVLAWIGGVIIAVSVLISALSALCRLRFYASSTIFGQAPPLLLIILPLLACGLALYKGIQGTARSGVIFTGVFIFFLALIGISLVEKLDFKWLYPAFIEDGESFVSQVLEQIGSNSEILYFAALMEHVEKKPQSTVFIYVPVVTVLLELMFMLEMLVLGPFLESVSFPFFTVSALSNIVLFQRLDGIDVAVWTLMCIVKISLALLSIRTVFARLISEKAGQIAGFAGLVIVGALAGFFGGSPSFTDMITKILTCGLPMILGGIIVPTAAIIAAAKKPKKKEEAVIENR
ncbi:MAG: spore germination protein [Firmicutes bacterium]|nr:spore germination protein [[Eubacterium] siraeum]MCM1488441.1 spore germination protein [Bacillota bacterium]